MWQYISKFKEVFSDEEKNYIMTVNRPFLFIIRNLDYPEGRDIIFISKITKL